MAGITLILQHFQDVLTGKAPFDQIPNSKEEDQYYEDPLECKNIHGRPQGSKKKNKNKNGIEPSRFEIIESQSKRRVIPPSKVTRTITSRSQSNVPSPIISSDLLPSATESNEYGISEDILRSSRRLAIGRKTSQRNSHKPATSLKIYDAIDLTCEHCQSNYHTSDECSKLFVSF
ncbi:hypothetical protein O181_129369 [Austropuccinia psidii MF-1]|uniref:Uncharacterized protein n=1 Tax=Austropuccinia psidii MF-1 TaxID=1389203 RepID=A0A9Q3Q914_9BASI|nr:hypothetical protein [Austropuccinia psidii MF-1]